MKTYFNLVVVTMLCLFANQATADCFFEPGEDRIFFSGFEQSCIIDSPIVVAAGNTTGDIFKDVMVRLKPGTASSAKYINLVIHNLQRLPNDAPMAYLQVINSNGSSWVSLNNTDVESGIVFINDKVKSYGGIGGGFHTLTMTIDVEKLENSLDGSRLFLSNENTFRFWINALAYSEGASAYRVTWLAVADSGWKRLSGRNARYGSGNAPDAIDYIAANTTANRTEGKTFWETKTLIAKPGDTDIRAKCMDCHTKSGYDLKYFGYTNESIYKRSRFHGFNDDEAKKLTRYIRNLDTPSYGRPWNPPYQPGEVRVAGKMVPLSSRPVERWAAGAGRGRVLKDDEDMLNYVFPDTNGNGAVDQAEVDNVFQLSQINSGASYLGISLIDIPIHLQLPDWNRWLPRVHPVDIWPDFKNVSSGDACPADSSDPDPYAAYSYLSDTLDAGNIPHKWRISNFFAKTAHFVAEGSTRSYGTSWPGGRVLTATPPSNIFRDSSIDNTCRLNVDILRAGSSSPYKDEMFDEYAKRAITHWMGVKYFEVHHVGGLEDELHEILNDLNLEDARGWGGPAPAVFNHAPHKTASNGTYWEGRTNTYDPDDIYYRDADDQTLVEGDYTSAVWYYLESILNSGHKQATGCCGPTDWAYNYLYFYRLGLHSGQPQTMMYLTTFIKNWQVRDITQGSENGTERGLNLRTMVPSLAYSINRELPDGDENIVARLDEYSPNLYRYFLNTVIKRWVQVVKHPDFPYRYSTNNVQNRLGDWPRSDDPTRWWSVLQSETYQPTNWDGESRLFRAKEIADNCWRLLPLLSDEGIGATLLEDYKNWCKAAWPGPAGNLNDWDGQIAN